jgi:hypothetical protein
MSRIFLEIERRRSQRMSDVLERLLEHSVILSNAFSILLGIPLVFGLLNAKQAVKDDALLLICTDLSCDLFFFDWLILGLLHSDGFEKLPLPLNGKCFYRQRFQC